MPKPVTDVSEGESGVIAELSGGSSFQGKMRSLGVREGKTVTMRAKQPFRGPVVLEIDGRQTTIGRGMAACILVD